MKIAFDWQIFFHQKFGGVSRYFVQLAHELALAGQDIGVFAPIYRNVYLRSLDRKCIHGYPVSDYPRGTTRWIESWNRWLSGMAMQRWQPDVQHETYYTDKSSVSTGRPVVLTVYDMIHELFAEEFSADDPTRERKEQAIRRADHIICISANTKRDLLGLFNIPEEKVSVIHLGFDLFDRGGSAQPQRLRPQRPYLLYVGHRGGYKNFMALMEAWGGSSSLVSDFDLVAFGGPPFSQAELALANGAARRKAIHVSGSDADLRALYRGAAAFIYPSKYEGFGIPPLEAMANGCAVISSNVSSMPEVIGEAAEYFDPESAEDLRRAIESVVHSPSRQVELRSLGEQRLRHFSWERCAKETLSVYQRVASS